ncbi:hypothetical protein BLS_008608 [Venturia inaequalis]|uniref:Uncharacterized protein n=1 Tax=Venturia inaequalis TaxID=5025 RepID=A0A8H3USY9_VENIN|nr:hypothetical protein EG328_003536 [Venturia inaequalis]KAE9980538.1 hypothetical protein BLS_008608 [Venturia inaequalis]KAE9989404.1 hypothetical protein EG327_002711 [Venturia inaequalis]
MDPNDPDADSLLQQMRKLSCSTTTNATSTSTTSQSETTSPLSPRAFRRPQRPRASHTGTRPKSIISISPYQRPSRKPSLNKDELDMDIVSPTTTNFLESLIQDINNTPISPSFAEFDFPAPELPRQKQSLISYPSKRRSGPPMPLLDVDVREEEVVTLEQERAAIRRYRRERFSLPEHEWWKLESKHRVAMAAMRRMDRSPGMDLHQNGSPGQDSPRSCYSRQHGGVVPGLKPEVVDALAFTHTPNPEAVKAIGENGLDLGNSSQVPPSLVRPPDCNPEAWEHWQHLDGLMDLQHHAYIGARISAYSFENGDIFDLRQARVQERLRRVEESWQHGKAAMNIETQFWNAVFERENQVDAFTQRDRYLLQANAVEFAAKMFIQSRSEREIHDQIFNRYLLTAFDCSEEDQEASSVDIPGLAIALLNFDSVLKDGEVSMSQDQDILFEATKRLGQLRFD